MPALIKTLDQIMHEQQKDVYILLFSMRDEKRDLQAQQDHFTWFKAKKLPFETAAPRGWLGGDPGRYAVYFDDDTRVAEYTATFEDASGRSLTPDSYQMFLHPYLAWLEDGGEKHWQHERNRSCCQW